MREVDRRAVFERLVPALAIDDRQRVDPARLGGIGGEPDKAVAPCGAFRVDRYRRIGRVIEQRDPVGAEHGLGHAADLDRWDRLGAELRNRIVEPDRTDHRIDDLDPHRRHRIRREQVDDLAAHRHLAGLVDAVVGGIADLAQHLGERRHVDRVADGERRRRVVERGGWGIGCCRCLGGGDEGDALPIGQCKAKTPQRGDPAADIGRRGGSGVARQCVARRAVHHHHFRRGARQRSGDGLGALLVGYDIEHVLRRCGVRERGCDDPDRRVARRFARSCQGRAGVSEQHRVAPVHIARRRPHLVLRSCSARHRGSLSQRQEPPNGRTCIFGPAKGAVILGD